MSSFDCDDGAMTIDRHSDNAEGAEGAERADILETLAQHRGFLRYTVQGLDDEQATRRTTASELCLGGIIKHVTAVEQSWGQFIEQGPDNSAPEDLAAGLEVHAAGFRMVGDETLALLLDRYAEVAGQTDKLVTELPSLDASQPLPPAPWNEPGKRWSARRVFLHIIAETSQHAGHADIIRESLDGAKSMG
jgi:Protein of unknown function (DUF664)